MPSRTFRRAAVWLFWFAASGHAFAQKQSEQVYSRLNTFTGFIEYSNDSSHIILGATPNRKIGGIGFQYQRRLIQHRYINAYYQAEIRPGMIESDPTLSNKTIETSPVQTTFTSGPTPVVECRAIDTDFRYVFQEPTGSTTFAGHIMQTCGRRTVALQGFAPAGIRLNLPPRHRIQVTTSSSAGYIFSTQPVPVPGAGSFNFAFDFGAGLEYYLTLKRSVRLEYLVQHYSNKYTADQNPGVDSGFVRLAYAFGH